jgi:hypothetical protein
MPQQLGRVGAFVGRARPAAGSPQELAGHARPYISMTVSAIIPD